MDQEGGSATPDLRRSLSCLNEITNSRRACSPSANDRGRNIMRYHGRNVVTTNPSSRNHGKPAVLTIQRRGHKLVLTHGMEDGGNSYAIELDAETAGGVAAELIAFSNKAALPELMGAIGVLLASDAAPSHEFGQPAAARLVAS